MTGKKQRKWPLMFLFFCPLLAAVALCELYLQIRQYQATRVISHSKYFFFETDPFLQIRPKYDLRYAADLHVNTDSFRGDPVDRDPAVYRIFTLGGSTTYSYLLPYNDTYPAKLEKKLKAGYPGRKIQVENAASDWYSSAHLIIRYFYVRNYRPDAIIVMEAMNDLFRSFVPEWWCRPGDSFRRDYSHYLGPIVGLEQERVKYFPFTEFLLYKKLRNRFVPPKGEEFKHINPDDPDFFDRVAKLTKPVPIREFQSLSVFEENLRLLIRLAKADNVKIILATQPNIYRSGLNAKESAGLYMGPVHCSQGGFYPDLASMEYGMRLFNDAIIRVSKESGVPVVDLEKQVPKTDAYFSDDLHPKDSATEIESQLLFDEIKRLRLIEE